MPCCEDCPCVNYCDGSMIEACMDDWRKRKQKESEVDNNMKSDFARKSSGCDEWYTPIEKSAPPFQSAYVCSGISDKQIIFEEI